MRAQDIGDGRYPNPAFHPQATTTITNEGAKWLNAHLDLPNLRRRAIAEHEPRVAGEIYGLMQNAAYDAFEAFARPRKQVVVEAKAAPPLVEMTTRQAADVLGVTTTQAVVLAIAKGRLRGAVKTSRGWVIPTESVNAYKQRKAG